MDRENASDLLVFLAVARERSFTRAAAKLGMSQSALSQIVRNLEERLAVRLLNRTTRSGAPSYFAGRKKPRTPRDLTEHYCLNLRLPTHGGLYAWEFEKDGRALNVRVDGQLVFNGAGPLLTASLNGFGLAYLMESNVQPY